LEAGEAEGEGVGGDAAELGDAGDAGPEAAAEVGDGPEESEENPDAEFTDGAELALPCGREPGVDDAEAV